MVCSASSYTGIRQDNFQWSNWSGRSKQQLGSLFIPGFGAIAPTASLPPPEGLKQLVKVVKDATDARMSLHSIGSGWAFDNQAVGDDWTIDISALRLRLLTTVGEAPVTNSPIDLVATGPGLTDEWRRIQSDRSSMRKLVHVEAGIKLWQLIQMLDSVGLALPTMGGANGQALAGVINTSVHGGDWNQPAFPGLVRALHLVTDGGREVWIEPISGAITQDDRLQPTLSCPEAEIVRSDEVFNAALVGLGRFGVVYSYVIEVRPQFWIAEVTTRPDRNAVFAALRSGAKRTGDPFGPLLQLLAANPGPASIPESRTNAVPSFFQLLLHTRNPPGIWVQRRWETNNQTDMNIGQPTDVSGDLVAKGLNILLSLFPIPINNNILLDFIVENVFNEQLNVSVTQGRRGRHAWITAGPPSGKFPDYRGVSVEVMFDANDPAYVDFLQAILSAGGSFRQVGWLSLRPSLATKATLSMHNVGGTHAVSIEIALLQDLPDNESFLTFIQNKAIELGGRLHWGQANNLLTQQIVSTQYGSLLESWKRSLWQVSGNSTVFSNNFTRQRGLEPEAPPAAFTPALQLLLSPSNDIQHSLPWLSLLC
jgi:hypothetical protein